MPEGNFVFFWSCRKSCRLLGSHYTNPEKSFNQLKKSKLSTTFPTTRDFLELTTPNEDDIIRLKTQTKLDRACLITIRSMGNNFLDEEFCDKRTLQTARDCFIDDIKELKTLITNFDDAEIQKKEHLARHSNTNRAQPITIVREDSSSWLTKPFQSFTVTATSTWSEIISNLSESFLKNPHTANFGEALRNSDCSKVKSQ